MSTISVPISKENESFIKSLVKSGKAANKAHAVRMALTRFEEEEFISEVLAAENDIKEGRVISGDLREIMSRQK